MKPSRILVYGVTGSGKTTTAERISKATGLPWYAVDDLTWEPGWVSVDEDEQRRRITKICAQDEWILDHAYGAWLDIPLARVELIVGLDYPRWLSLSRLVRRTLARMIDKKPICNGNYQTVRRMLTRDSIIGWHFRSFARKRERMRAWETDPNAPDILRFEAPSELDAWISGLNEKP